nr:hypothetical protein [Actinomadura madurae]
MTTAYRMPGRGGDHRPDDRQQRTIDEDHIVGGVLDDVADLLAEQPVIDGVQDPAGARHGQIQLDMPLAVPPERSNPGLMRNLQTIQHRRKTARPLTDLTPSRNRLPHGMARHHSLVPEIPLNPPEDQGKGQGSFLHQAVHPVGVPPRRETY